MNEEFNNNNNVGTTPVEPTQPAAPENNVFAQAQQSAEQTQQTVDMIQNKMAENGGSPMLAVMQLEQEAAAQQSPVEEPTPAPVVEEPAMEQTYEQPAAPVAPQPAAPVQVTPPIIERKTNGFAIAGLVFSLIGSGILGLILSIVGLVKFKTTYSGKGMSIAGIIISIIKLLLVVLLFSSIAALVGGVFGMVKEECGKATNCVLQADGTYECTKIDDNGVKLTLSCPAEYVNESAKKNDPNKGMIPDDEAQPKTETGIDEERDKEKEETKEQLDETIIHPNEVKPIPFNSNNI